MKRFYLPCKLMKKTVLSPYYTREGHQYGFKDILTREELELNNKNYVKPYSESNTHEWGVEIKTVKHYKTLASGYLNLDRCCAADYCGGYGCYLGEPVPFISQLVIPSNVTKLSCADNGWKYIPQLPSNLIYLNCRENELTSLPRLPDGLEYLDCGMNKLTSLPRLPDGLRYLDCGGNDLIGLPELPDTLEVLVCNNVLSDLTEPPKSLKEIYVLDK